MYTEDGAQVYPVEITFHFVDGHTESFAIDPTLYGSLINVRHEMRRFLAEGWWVIKLPEETVFINANNVLKFEVKSSVSLAGEGVLTGLERVTALTKSR